MKTFKELKESLILLEILNTDEKKEVDTWTKGDNSFSDHMYKDHPHDAHFELESPDDSEHKPHIENHISKHGFKIKDYKKGIATDKHGRETSIGKALVKTKAPIELKHKFDNDPSRQQQQVNSDYHVVISRHPHHVAGMTSEGHEWQSSCMNFRGGAMNHHLKDDVKHGTHVAYLVHKDDHEIKNPLARIALKKYTNEDDPNDHILRPEDKTYGNAPDSFTHTLHKAMDKHFPGKHDGIYKKNENVYNDGSNEYVVGKDAIDAALNHKDSNIRHSALTHPDLTEKHIDEVMKNHDAEAKITVLRHKNATKKHVDEALNDPYHKIRRGAALSPALTAEHIHKILDDNDEVQQSIALSHKNVNSEHIEKALKSENMNTRRDAIRHENATPEQLHKVLDSDENILKYSAMSNPSLNSEHLHKALHPSMHRLIREEAIKHRNIKPEHIEKALKDEESTISNRAKYRKKNLDLNN